MPRVRLRRQRGNLSCSLFGSGCAGRRPQRHGGGENHRARGVQGASGKRIASELAGVDCAGLAATFSRFCNWRIDFSYADTDNKSYRTSRGSTRPECKGDPLRHAQPQTLPTYGKACAKFFVNGKLRAVQCHFLTK
ncbi:hypothetical protein [Streptomyces phaeoluteigriseus]